MENIHPFRVDRVTTKFVARIKYWIGVLLMALPWVVVWNSPSFASGVGVKARLAWQPAVQMAFFVARENKIFEKYGLNPEYIRFNAAPPMFSSFRSGSIDLGYMGAVPATILLSESEDLKIIYIEADESTGESLIVHPDSGIKSISDLKGKTIGIWRGTSSDYALEKGLGSAGLSLSDIKVLNLDVTAIAPALEKREIDGVWVWDPWAFELQEKVGAVQIATDADVGISMPDVWVARQSWLDSSDGALKFIKAMEEAKKIVLNDKKLAAKITSSILNQDEETSLKIIDRASFPTADELIREDHIISLNPSAIAAGNGLAKQLNHISEFMLERGLISNSVDLKRKIDGRYVKEYMGGRQ